MGEFFNEVVMDMHKVPVGRTKKTESLEGLRVKFNEEQKEETVKEKRVANLVKAREAKAKKNG